MQAEGDSKIYIKMLWKKKMLWIKYSQGSLEELNIKTYNQGTVTKTVWHWYKDKQQISGTEQVWQTDPSIFGHLIYNRCGNIVLWRRSIFSLKWYWVNTHEDKMNLGSLHYVQK